VPTAFHVDVNKRSPWSFGGQFARPPPKRLHLNRIAASRYVPFVVGDLVTEPPWNPRGCGFAVGLRSTTRAVSGSHQYSAHLGRGGLGIDWLLGH
jgi:hypothetical protein